MKLLVSIAMGLSIGLWLVSVVEDSVLEKVSIRICIKVRTDNFTKCVVPLHLTKKMQKMHDLFDVTFQKIQLRRNVSFRHIAPLRRTKKKGKK